MRFLHPRTSKAQSEKVTSSARAVGGAASVCFFAFFLNTPVAPLEWRLLMWKTPGGVRYKPNPSRWCRYVYVQWYRCTAFICRCSARTGTVVHQWPRSHFGPFMPTRYIYRYFPRTEIKPGKNYPLGGYSTVGGLWIAPFMINITHLRTKPLHPNYYSVTHI